MNVRIIARLDIKGPNLVKGVQMEGLRVLGKPERFAAWYYENGVDELFYQDVVASLYGRNSLDDIISRTARQVFVPLCVGGGLRSIEDINRVLRAGADKVALNTAAVRDPTLVRRAARRFGSSTIVAAIEVIRQPSGAYEAFTDNGRERTGLEAVPWAERLVEEGAGELLIMSVDRDGTGQGFDHEILSAIAERVSVPVIAAGGGGSAEHVCQVLEATQVSAVTCASLFHYEALAHIDLSDDFAAPINLTAMRTRSTYGRIQAAGIDEVKRAAAERGHQVRLPGPDVQVGNQT